MTLRHHVRVPAVFLALTPAPAQPVTVTAQAGATANPSANSR